MHRGVRNIGNLSDLTKEQILAWADEHHRCTGNWPRTQTESIPGGPPVEWVSIHLYLSYGGRGLPGGSSLARLLEEHRGVPIASPPISIAQILEWADACHQRTGRWPSKESNELIEGTRAEKWAAIEKALRHGYRGLPKGQTLARVLQQYRGVQTTPICPS